MLLDGSDWPPYTNGRETHNEISVLEASRTFQNFRVTEEVQS